MSLTLNMVGGGGGGLSATDALLRVQAPAGSTVTITKGTTTKTDLGHENADDHTVYDYYFIIHASQFDSVNPWTVTATDGSDTASDTIIINAADEYDVELSYVFYIFKHNVGQVVALGTNNNYNAQTTITTEKITATNSGSNGGQGSMFTDVTIDFTGYATAHFMLHCTDNYGGDNFGLRMHVTSSKPAGNSQNPTAITKRSFGTNSDFTDVTLDVSNVNGSYYLGIWGIGKWECTDIWLTED